MQAPLLSSFGVPHLLSPVAGIGDGPLMGPLVPPVLTGVPLVLDSDGFVGIRHFSSLDSVKGYGLRGVKEGVAVGDTNTMPPPLMPSAGLGRCSPQLPPLSSLPEEPSAMIAPQGSDNPLSPACVFVRGVRGLLRHTPATTRNGCAVSGSGATDALVGPIMVTSPQSVVSSPTTLRISNPSSPALTSRCAAVNAVGADDPLGGLCDVAMPCTSANNNSSSSTFATSSGFASTSAVAGGANLGLPRTRSTVSWATEQLCGGAGCRPAEDAAEGNCALGVQSKVSTRRLNQRAVSTFVPPARQCVGTPSNVLASRPETSPKDNRCRLLPLSQGLEDSSVGLCSLDVVGSIRGDRLRPPSPSPSLSRQQGGSPVSALGSGSAFLSPAYHHCNVPGVGCGRVSPRAQAAGQQPTGGSAAAPCFNASNSLVVVAAGGHCGALAGGFSGATPLSRTRSDVLVIGRGGRKSLLTLEGALGGASVDEGACEHQQSGMHHFGSGASAGGGCMRRRASCSYFAPSLAGMCSTSSHQAGVEGRGTGLLSMASCEGSCIGTPIRRADPLYACGAGGAGGGASPPPMADPSLRVPSLLSFEGGPNHNQPAGPLIPPPAAAAGAPLCPLWDSGAHEGFTLNNTLNACEGAPSTPTMGDVGGSEVVSPFIMNPVGRHGSGARSPSHNGPVGGGQSSSRVLSVGSPSYHSSHFGTGYSSMLMSGAPNGAGGGGYNSNSHIRHQEGLRSASVASAAGGRWAATSKIALPYYYDHSGQARGGGSAGPPYLRGDSPLVGVGGGGGASPSSSSKYSGAAPPPALGLDGSTGRSSAGGFVATTVVSGSGGSARGDHQTVGIDGALTCTDGDCSRADGGGSGWGDKTSLGSGPCHERGASQDGGAPSSDGGGPELTPHSGLLAHVIPTASGDDMGAVGGNIAFGNEMRGGILRATASVGACCGGGEVGGDGQEEQRSFTATTPPPFANVGIGAEEDPPDARRRCMYVAQEGFRRGFEGGSSILSCAADGEGGGFAPLIPPAQREEGRGSGVLHWNHLQCAFAASGSAGPLLPPDFFSSAVHGGRMAMAGGAQLPLSASAASLSVGAGGAVSIPIGRGSVGGSVGAGAGAGGGCGASTASSCSYYDSDSLSLQPVVSGSAVATAHCAAGGAPASRGVPPRERSLLSPDSVASGEGGQRSTAFILPSPEVL